MDDVLVSTVNITFDISYMVAIKNIIKHTSWHY